MLSSVRIRLMTALLLAIVPRFNRETSTGTSPTPTSSSMNPSTTVTASSTRSASGSGTTVSGTVTITSTLTVSCNNSASTSSTSSISTTSYDGKFFPWTDLPIAKNSSYCNIVGVIPFWKTMETEDWTDDYGKLAYFALNWNYSSLHSMEMIPFNNTQVFPWNSSGSDNNLRDHLWYFPRVKLHLLLETPVRAWNFWNLALWPPLNYTGKRADNTINGNAHSVGNFTEHDSQYIMDTSVWTMPEREGQPPGRLSRAM
ncbi:hypothetical protein QBC35DRAFT_544248 [Podospora australis]|uniref:Glycoside Hydrolase Family 16 n=1 Tax=Podospora australis TaxID=1536484 RepID=A0AAN7AET9_9PEZI|nr:hypothetical protein QBC35DRAFT_544248 [Podospora australis]